MDIYIVTQDDPFYMPIFFKKFFDKLSKDVNARKIFCLDAFDESIASLIHRMYQLYGPIGFSKRSASYIGRKVRDVWEGEAYSVYSVARMNDIDIQDIDSVNSSEFFGRVKEQEVSVVLSVSAPEIFGPSLLTAPTWGCLNVHTAKLPQYRGMLPTFWALYHGDDEIGVTVHTMEEEIDQGQIAMQSTFPVAASDTLDDVIKRGKHEGGRLAAQALNTLAKGELQLRPMEGEGSYFSFPSAEERRELQQKGRRLL